MTTVYKVLGQSYPSSQTATTLYTVPAANSTVVSTITIANLAATYANFTIAVRPAGATLTNSQYISYQTSLAPNDTVGLTLGITLGNTDVISVSSNTGNVTFNAFGSENY